MTEDHEFDMGPDEGDPRNPNNDPAISQSAPVGKSDIGLHPPDTLNPHKEGVFKGEPDTPDTIIGRIRVGLAHKLFDPKSQN